MLLFTLALNYAVSARNNWIQIDATSSSAVFPSTGTSNFGYNAIVNAPVCDLKEINKIAELEPKGIYLLFKKKIWKKKLL